MTKGKIIMQCDSCTFLVEEIAFVGKLYGTEEDKTVIVLKSGYTEVIEQSYAEVMEGINEYQS